MFTKSLLSFLYFISFWSILAAAAPGGGPPHTTPTPTPTPTKTVTVTATAPAATTISQCNTGDSQCCNTVGAANSLPAAGLLLGLLGIVLQDLSVIVGLGCTPITIIGLGGGANCAQQPVCCSNNNFNGLINIGCTPISL